jgi:Sulfotransferase family
MPLESSTLKAEVPAMERFFAHFNNVEEFNYSVHISEEFRFIYFNNPKSACTTIKASLNLACAAAIGRKLEYRSIADIHNRDHNLLLRPDQVGYARFREMLGDASYFKFCFLREPVQRIASAFSSKLAWQSGSLARLNRILHRSDHAPLSFPQFIDILLSNREVRDIDEHWRLQRKQICFDFVPFDKIGLFESLASDLEAVLRRLFGQGAERWVFDVRQNFSGNVSDSGALMRTLAPAMKTVITEIHKDDVSLYAAVANPDDHTLTRRVREP